MAEGWIDFAQLKEQVSIPEVLNRYGLDKNLKAGSSGRLTGPCPVHKGKSATAFNVTANGRAWNCFSGSCKGGNVLDLVMQLEDCNVRDAGKKLTEMFGLTFTKEKAGKDGKTATASGKNSSERAPAEQQADTKNRPLERALKLNDNHSYLYERGLTVETIKTFGVGFCSRGIMRGRVALPIHDEEGQLVAYVGRAITDDQAEKTGKYKLPRGFEKCHVVWNLNRAKDHAEDGLIVVEGFFDAMHVHQAGYPNVVALMGSSLSEHQEHLLAGETDRLALMFDGDEAGRNCMREFYKRLRRQVYLKEIHLQEGQQPDGLTKKAIAELLS